MVDIKSMNLEEMGVFFRELSEPAFRAKQVFTWLHRGARSFDEMSNLSKALRSKLAETCRITVPTVARKQSSRLDGTIKYLWELQDGNCIETVFFQKRCHALAGDMTGIVIVQTEAHLPELGELPHHLQDRNGGCPAASHIVMLLPVFRVEGDIGE